MTGVVNVGLSVDDIVTIAARHFGIDKGDLTGPSRVRRFTAYRFATAAALRHLTPASYPEIARAIGRRDHTTALHAVRRSETDPALRGLVSDLVAAVEKDRKLLGQIDWAVATRCRCGWRKVVTLPVDSSSTDVLDAFHRLREQLRHHRHVEQVAG